MAYSIVMALMGGGAAFLGLRVLPKGGGRVSIWAILAGVLLLFLGTLLLANAFWAAGTRLDRDGNSGQVQLTPSTTQVGNASAAERSASAPVFPRDPGSVSPRSPTGGD